MKKESVGTFSDAPIAEEGGNLLQERPYEEALQKMDGYEFMLKITAQNAKAYWKQWGSLGEPMVRSIDAWAEMQIGYLQWLRRAYGSRG
jgi:hypothetical protein